MLTMYVTKAIFVIQNNYYINFIKLQSRKKCVKYFVNIIHTYYIGILYDNEICTIVNWNKNTTSSLTAVFVPMRNC